MAMKSPSNPTLATGDSSPPRRLNRTVACANAPPVVAAAATGAAASIPHASTVPPPLSKPSSPGKKSAEDAAGATPAKAKPQGSTGTKSLRNTVPAEEETQLKPPEKKKVGPPTFILRHECDRDMNSYFFFKFYEFILSICM